ncbi:hypothetical protein LOD99_2362 [Oopsacas minuta]|uniref:SPRY domain-containing protein 7 n=1 Tax=Oopsacas minuta TaxID=111878 RepID=A0AAV7K2B6_9METZ|nr:hypothetical protein LOD99_2362 [Oopsacas minuta]
MFQNVNNTISSLFCGCNCFRWPLRNRTGRYVRLKTLDTVTLNENQMGINCVLVKSGRRLCGSGIALANAPLLQEKSYFEIKIQTDGIWGVGISQEDINLDQVPLGEDEKSWVLRSDSRVYHKGDVLFSLKERVEEGDIISIAYDQVELSIFINGNSMSQSVNGIKGEMFPALYVLHKAFFIIPNCDTKL